MTKIVKKQNTPYTISEITSIIAHQLKTPLSGIKSSLEVLLAGDLGGITKDQREYLTLTLEKTERLIGLVKNLLDVSRIEEERLQLQLAPVDLKNMVKGVVSDLKFIAHAKNSSITVNVGNDIPLVTADAMKIRQVVYNIIDNAIHYNKGKGAIEVMLKKKGDEVIFSCTDHGIGISKEDAKKIFSKYFRSDRVMRLAPDGTGLGLFISKAIIEKSGGRIWYKSAEGKGTSFYFSLPIHQDL